MSGLLPFRGEEVDGAGEGQERFAMGDYRQEFSNSLSIIKERHMIPEGRIAETINQEDDIFDIARRLAHERKPVLSSPLVITRSCRLSPLCRHCSWRSGRALMKDYAHAKVNKEEAVSRAMRIQQSGADCVFLVSGWMGKALPDYFFECIEAIRQTTQIEIAVTFGAISKPDLMTLRGIGVDHVSCGLETTNLKAFHDLKPGDSFETRLETLRVAKEMGFRVRTNFLIGIGETIDDLDDSIRLAEQLGIDFLSISSLQPTPFTETEKWDRPKPYVVAKVAAAARIALPNVDIQVSFGCDTYTDLAWGMKSGANAFSIALRNPQETPELLGDETTRLRIMWNDYSVREKTSPASSS
ncbi:MAG: radical SAM protein [Syntrophorhabdales bacterium]